jgi:hypothetical protein
MQPNNLFELSRLKHTKSLYWLAVISVLGAVVLVPFWIFDARELGGVSVWEKPLKFFTSSATSHFNVSTPAAIVIWSLMATFISIVLFATLFLSIMILLQKQQEFDLKLTLVLGSLNTAVGMGLAYLMTSPTANQLANFQGIAGAHAVGVEDGGPGLPFFGWSTVAGDLRVGHFFGLHSIQVAAILLAVALVLPSVLRVPLLIVGNLTWLGFVGLVTWQSLRAEPFSSPSQLTLTGFGVLLAVAAVSFAVLVIWQRSRKPKQLA